MNDLEGMQKPHPNDQLHCNLSSLILLKILGIPHKVKEISSPHQFRHYVDMILSLDCFFELEQQGMRYYSHYCALVARWKQEYAMSERTSF